MADPSIAIAFNEQRSTRDQILDEALECFAHAGYDGTSLNASPWCGIRARAVASFTRNAALYGEVSTRPVGFVARLADAIESPKSVGEGRARAARIRFFATTLFVR